MASTNADQIFAQIERDFVELSKNAAKDAATKAQKDIRKKADKFIKEYYAYQPKVYKNRKHALYKLVEDYFMASETANGVEIEFGITYNPGNISGIHKSNSKYHQGGGKWISRDSPDFKWDSGDNGVPEPEWITDQFLDGIHPWSGEDAQSPDQKMQSFFDKELDALVSKYISTSLMSALKSYF